MTVVIEDKDAKLKELVGLIIEARDALPAISLTSARLHGIDLTLADRIEEALLPWLIVDTSTESDPND